MWLEKGPQRKTPLDTLEIKDKNEDGTHRLPNKPKDPLVVQDKESVKGDKGIERHAGSNKSGDDESDLTFGKPKSSASDNLAAKLSDESIKKRRELTLQVRYLILFYFSDQRRKLCPRWPHLCP
jgi:hypothetical protein